MCARCAARGARARARARAALLQVINLLLFAIRVFFFEKKRIRVKWPSIPGTSMSFDIRGKGRHIRCGNPGLKADSFCCGRRRTRKWAAGLLPAGANNGESAHAHVPRQPSPRRRSLMRQDCAHSPPSLSRTRDVRVCPCVACVGTQGHGQKGIQRYKYRALPPPEVDSPPHQQFTMIFLSTFSRARTPRLGGGGGGGGANAAHLRLCSLRLVV